MLRNKILIAALAAPMLIAAPAFAAANVEVTMWDNTDMDMSETLGHGMGGDLSKANMGLALDHAEVAAGSVTFNVRNGSEDLQHEMVIAPLTSADEILPYVADEDRVDEDAAGYLGEVEELEPGDSGAVTVNLEPGRYILYCNLPMHYMAGMWTVLTVK